MPYVNLTCPKCGGTGRVSHFFFFNKLCKECKGRGVTTIFFPDKMQTHASMKRRPHVLPKREAPVKPITNKVERPEPWPSPPIWNNDAPTKQSSTEPFEPGGGTFGGAGASGSWDSPSETQPSSHEEASSTSSSDSGNSSDGTDSGSSGGGSGGGSSE